MVDPSDSFRTVSEVTHLGFFANNDELIILIIPRFKHETATVR